MTADAAGLVGQARSDYIRAQTEQLPTLTGIKQQNADSGTTRAQTGADVATQGTIPLRQAQTTAIPQTTDARTATAAAATSRAATAAAAQTANADIQNRRLELMKTGMDARTAFQQATTEVNRARAAGALVTGTASKISGAPSITPTQARTQLGLPAPGTGIVPVTPTQAAPQTAPTPPRTAAPPPIPTLPPWVKPGDQYSPSRGQARDAAGNVYGPDD
jgi:hypothetical protein